jgi:putative flippase GtrA
MNGAVKNGFWFLAVGSTAALTHLAVFTLLQHRIWPELAGFATNEGVFVLLLRGAGLPALAALLVALVAAAGQTFLLSRFWAFRR